METALSRIWTRVVLFIAFDDNRNAKRASNLQNTLFSIKKTSIYSGNFGDSKNIDYSSRSKGGSAYKV